MLMIRDFDYIGRDSIGIMNESLEGLEFSGIDDNGFDDIVRGSEARALEDIFENIRVQRARVLLLAGEGGTVAMRDLDSSLKGFSYTSIKDGAFEIDNIIVPKNPARCLVIADAYDGSDGGQDIAYFYFIEAL